MELLKKENISILEKAKDWKEAVRLSVKPLEREDFVEPRYKDEIIANVEKMGPYIVLAPGIALPHARPEQGVKESQIAITLFREPVAFEKEDKSAQLFITLAAADNSQHLDALIKISTVLEDEANVSKILQAEDTEVIYNYFCG